MPKVTERDLTGLGRHELVRMVLDGAKEAEFYESRHREILGRCNDLLEEARSARGREREALRIIATAIESAGRADLEAPRARNVSVPLVGIAGAAGAGKSTVARVLVDELGFVEMSLAAPMKEFCRSVFGFSDEQLFGPSKYRNAPDARFGAGPECFGAWAAAEDAVLENGPAWLEEIGLGVDAMPELRCWFDDITVLCAGRWGRAPVEKCSPRLCLQYLGTQFGREVSPDIWVDCLLKRVAESKHPVVVADVRFENEVRAIRAAGGWLVLVKREGTGIGGARGAHQSETELQGLSEELFDSKLVNVETIEEAKARAREIGAGVLGIWDATRGTPIAPPPVAPELIS